MMRPAVPRLRLAEGQTAIRPFARGDIDALLEIRVRNREKARVLIGNRIPVISSVAADRSGQAHNINADTVAGELAAALQAEKLILLTDTPGILRNRDDPASLIRSVTLSGARELIASGVVAGGMTPKTECCIRALAQGVAAAHIVDGRTPHALLLEVFTDAGIGTMVVGRTSAGQG